MGARPINPIYLVSPRPKQSRFFFQHEQQSYPESNALASMPDFDELEADPDVPPLKKVFLHRIRNPGHLPDH